MVLDTGSRANGYLLCTKSEALVIEAGVSLLQVKKAINFQLSMIRGCIVSHRHQDHARHIRQYAGAGIDVFGPADVFTTDHHRHHAISPGKGIRLGGFRVIAFDLWHDVPCYGYLIDHPESGRILFITDTYLCEYVLPNLRHIIIEANYADDILEANIFSGIEPASKRERLLTTHMELQTTKAVIKAQDLSTVQNIILIHLSDNNSDEALFAEEISACTGIRTIAARAGLEINLSNEPF